LKQCSEGKIGSGAAVGEVGIDGRADCTSFGVAAE